MIDPHPIVLVAMGGHAFMQPGEAGTIGDHERNAAQIASLLMTLVERDYYLCITHGNGPQVGGLLLQQEHARDEVPSLPLDVLVAIQLLALFAYRIAGPLSAGPRSDAVPDPSSAGARGDS